MSNKPIIADPLKRHYNQWVSNEMLEDCALRFTSLKSRRWSCFQVANTALGAISFLALEAIGAVITLQYGPVNALYAIAVVSALIFLLSIPIAIYAAKAGVDIDLLTRGSGFGYLGSTITSLIYAGFTFIYFALEAAIMATALHVCFGIPLSIGYLLCSLIVIPVVVYGITLISKLQSYTQHLWLALQLLPFVFLFWQSLHPMEGWVGLDMGVLDESQAFDWMMFGAASAVVFSLIVQIGEQVDYLRFLPVKTARNSTHWWFALLLSGPGWIIIGSIKMLAGVYLCMLALEHGLVLSQATDPVHLYLNVWASWLSPELALATTGIFVIVCQFKINITNSYAGSIAWSNFFSRLTHSHPGRVVWLVFNVTIAWMLMELGVYTSLENTLRLYSILGVSWIGAIAADLTINKILGLSPPGIQFKRAQLYDINPVGVGGMAASTAIGLIAYSGFWGPLPESMATYLTLVCVLLLVPLLAFVTGGRYYLVKNATGIASQENTAMTCCICRNAYDNEDLISCPAYDGIICSLCCSLDTRCEDQCRPEAPFLNQLRLWAYSLTPDSGTSHTKRLVLQFAALAIVTAAMIAFAFGLVFLQSGHSINDASPDVTAFTLNLFAAMLVLATIVAWMFLLAAESARRARQDTARQNDLLQKEIRAHETTALALDVARQKAEAANEAKSRYVIGLSHELRTPLNSVLGYAQLMEQDPRLPEQRKNGVRVIRDSAQHLSGLIDNLLDISRIEANRLTIHRNQLDLHDFLNQLNQMFRIQARSSGLEFRILISQHVPRRVFADEKRLRQVLINLLSNAFKYTQRGCVKLSVDYRSQVTTFKVCDTGVGISKTHTARIFQPFETLLDANTTMPKGTGLGLTISKLLAEIMGGDLSVTSVVGQGSSFNLRLQLPPIAGENYSTPNLRMKRRQLSRSVSIVVVDDDENHRNLLSEFLQPMGFVVHTFRNASSCLDALDQTPADMYLLDISMPDVSGWELAKELRIRCISRDRILMVSAHTDEYAQGHSHDSSSRNNLAKPLDLNKLVSSLDDILGLQWDDTSVENLVCLDSAQQTDSHMGGDMLITKNQLQNDVELPEGALKQIQHLFLIGHVSALSSLLKEIATSHPAASEFSAAGIELLARHELDAFAVLLSQNTGEQA